MGGAKNVAKDYCIFGNNYLCLFFKMAALGQTPGAKTNQKKW